MGRRGHSEKPVAGLTPLHVRSDRRVSLQWALLCPPGAAGEAASKGASPASSKCASGARGLRAGPAPQVIGAPIILIHVRPCPHFIHF